MQGGKSEYYISFARKPRKIGVEQIKKWYRLTPVNQLLGRAAALGGDVSHAFKENIFKSPLES